MREAVGTTWIFQLVIVFILIFAAYLALTINYSKAFKVKDEALTIIEKYEGISSEAIRTVNNYLISSAYRETGSCPSGYRGIKDLNSTSLTDVTPNGKYYWCVYKITGYNTTYPKKSYYKVRMFFKFNLPVLGNMAVYNVDGQTYEMDKTHD